MCRILVFTVPSITVNLPYKSTLGLEDTDLEHIHYPDS